MLKIHMLPAGKGDFFIIEFGENGKEHYIFIDGGDLTGAPFYKKSLNVIKEKKKKIDAIIFTHIDDDHIQGALCAMNSTAELPEIEKIYINTGIEVEKKLNIKINESKPEDCERDYLRQDSRLHSVRKAMCLRELFVKKKIEDKIQECVCMGESIDIGSASLKIISPSKLKMEIYLKEWQKEEKKYSNRKIHAGIDMEDKKELSTYQDEEVIEDFNCKNGSSIGFIFEYNFCKLAFLADAHPSVCVDGIKCFYPRGLEVEAIKVPHHGSKHNFSEELYSMLRTKTFLLSTNGKGNKPDPVFLGKLFHKIPNAKLYCNMNWMKNYRFAKADQQMYLKKDCPQICLIDGDHNLSKEIVITNKNIE